MTLLVAGVLLTLLAASVMVIRIQRRRRSQARVAAAAEREATKYRADAWTEAGRRIQVEPRREVGSDDDTVDMDPGDLGPEDIDLDDDEPPYNGRGPR